MGYTIHYGPEPKVAKLRHKHHGGIWIIAAMLALTVMIANYFRPEEMRLLKEALFPWTQPAVKAAFAEFVTDLRQGDTLHDAAAAFCIEVIENAAS